MPFPQPYLGGERGFFRRMDSQPRSPNCYSMKKTEDHNKLIWLEEKGKTAQVNWVISTERVAHETS